MIWKWKVFVLPSEVIEFLNSLGNGCDYEAKIVYIASHIYVFYPEKKV